METVLLVAAGLLVGAVAALKVFAPRTKNKVDDALLAKLEAVEDLVKSLLPKQDPQPEPKPLAKAAGPKAKK